MTLTPPEPPVPEVDLEAYFAYLDHPGTIARFDQMAAEARDLPPVERVANLAPHLVTRLREREELRSLLADAAPDDARHRVLSAIEEQVHLILDRIGEAVGPPPDVDP